MTNTSRLIVRLFWTSVPTLMFSAMPHPCVIRIPNRSVSLCLKSKDNRAALQNAYRRLGKLNLADSVRLSSMSKTGGTT